MKLRNNYSRSLNRRGAAAVEVALVMPVFVILLIGLWEVGRIAEVQQYLTNATREGARQASTGVKSSTEVKQTVVDYLTNHGITATTSNVTVTSVSNTAITDPSDAAQLDQFRVSVSIPFNNVRWVALNRVTGMANLTASADWYSMTDVPLTVSSSIPLK